MTPRRSITEKRWTRGFIVAFLGITTTIMVIARPVVANAEKITLVLDDGKKMEIEYDSSLVNVSANVEGKKLDVSKQASYPIELGKNTRKIVGIYPGPVPVIIFEGNSNCYLIGGRWIGFPAGTVCP
ncbi:MAG: hypothetical protein PHP88_11690 [bacterium]|nr:hypothetical protein [bacterium]